MTNFIIIRMCTLKRVSSEVRCHVESADCHLAVSASRTNLLLSLLHQQHHQHQSSSLPSSPDHMRFTISNPHFLALALRWRSVHPTMTKNVPDSDEGDTFRRASVARTGRTKGIRRASSFFLFLLRDTKRDEPASSGVSARTAGSFARDRRIHEETQRQARKKGKPSQEGSASPLRCS